MITIKKAIFEKKLMKARKLLIEKGLIALDGSGYQDIEALFTLLRWFEQGQIKIINQ